jgi:H+/Cl- antiporter ClcA
MKTKLNILCLLLLIAFAGCMYNAFLGGMEGASDASHGDIGNKLKPLFYVNVVPTEGNELNDSIPSVIEKGNFLKYHITSIKIEQENTPKDTLFQLVMGIITIPFGLITLAALYCFTRLILSIRKKDLFNPSNVFRVRLISATIIVASIIRTLAQYINYDIATHSIQLYGYQVENVQIPWSMFLSALLLAIFAEIYAQAIKLKEEQDLTI